MFLDPGFEGNPDPFPFSAIPPADEPAGGELMTIRVNRQWLEFVTGAACALVLSKTWDVATDDERKEIRARAQDLLGVLNTPIEEPPFYESDETADDVQLPVEPWYESLSDWVITAFLAITFTPGAAIVYKTTIPKLRLAFRTGDLGAIVRVLLDDLEIWTGDTNAAEIGLLEANLDVESFAAEHSLGAGPYTLKIIHGGVPLGAVPRLFETSAYKLEVELGDIRPRTGSLELRQNGCVIQVSTDGANWDTLYDPTSCVEGLIDTGIQDRIADGTLGRPFGQLQPAEPPAPEQCQTYYVTLNANSQWTLPSLLGYGDTIQVTDMTGGWSDGTIAWRGPDGSAYAFGEYGHAGYTHADDDILNPTAYHMALIMRVGETWFPAPTDSFTNEAGTTPLAVTFQANDDPISDNTGSIEFTVTVCSAPATINLTYPGGWGTSGPASVSVNEAFFITCTLNAGAYVFGGFRTDTPVKIEILTGGTGVPYWNEGANIQSGILRGVDPDESFGFAPWPTGVSVGRHTEVALNGTLQVFTVQIRLSDPG